MIRFCSTFKRFLWIADLFIAKAIHEVMRGYQIINISALSKLSKNGTKI